MKEHQHPCGHIKQEWRPLETMLTFVDIAMIDRVELGIMRKNGTITRMGFLDCVFRCPTHWRFRW